MRFSIIIGIFSIRITKIATIATELLMRLILPISEEYASLIDEPTIGIIELIRNRIPFTLTLSSVTDKMLRILRKPVKTEAVKPSIVLKVLFVIEIYLDRFVVSFMANDIPRQKYTPIKSLKPNDMTDEIISAKNTTKVL